MPPFNKGAVAQLVEHHVRNVGVTSSSLVRSTIITSLYAASYDGESFLVSLFINGVNHNS